MWALSTMRHRPSEEFSNDLQQILLSAVKDDPDQVHPQNIGDLVQALAVLRLPVVEGLLPACEDWMVKNIDSLLPLHVFAYLNVRSQLACCACWSLALKVSCQTFEVRLRRLRCFLALLGTTHLALRAALSSGTWLAGELETELAPSACRQAPGCAQRAGG